MDRAAAGIRKYPALSSKQDSKGETTQDYGSTPGLVQYRYIGSSIHHSIHKSAWGEGVSGGGMMGVAETSHQVLFIRTMILKHDGESNPIQAPIMFIRILSAHVNDSPLNLKPLVVSFWMKEASTPWQKHCARFIQSKIPRVKQPGNMDRHPDWFNKGI
jgi:hypothetical protein